jgi:uncharacterized protein YdeI (BOF family)
VLVVKASTYVKEIVVSQKGVLGNQMSVDEVMSAEAGTELTVRNALVYGINERGFVMGDDTGLILVYNESMTLVKDVKAGDRIDIEGTVGSYGISQIIPTKITVLSSGNEVPQLEPSVITKDNISMADRTMVNYVEMEGIYVKSGDYNNIKVIGSTISGSISYPIADLGLADMVGQVMFYGPGAGKLPTASAVCADIVDVIAHMESGIKLPTFEVASDEDVADFNGYSCKRFFIFDKCPQCNIDSECVNKCFGVPCSYSVFGNKVAVITDKMTEAEANAVIGKLNSCKHYRVL